MNLIKRILLVVLGVAYVFAGVNHFIATDFYVAIMPPYLPWHLELVYLSGLAEIFLGLAVWIPRYRKHAAWGLILLLIAIFPANLHVALNDVGIGGAEPNSVANWVRLPIQGLLILWAWWYTRPEPAVANPEATA